MEAALPHPARAALAEYLARTGVSKRALSLALGLGDKWVGDFLSGRVRDPDPESLGAVANLLNTAAEALQPQRIDNASPGTRTGPFMSDVLAAVRQSAWSAERKDKTCRDLTLFCTEWLHRAPETVPADRRWLRSHLNRLTPAAVGVSRKRFSNVKWALGAALDLAVAPRGPAKPIRFLGSEWKVLYDALPKPAQRGQSPSGPTGAQVRKGPLTWLAPSLSPLMRYCDEAGISPGEVNDDTLMAFAAHRDQYDLSGDPKRKIKTTRVAWNRAARAIESWPKQRLSAGLRRQPLMLPLSAFPDSFQSDLGRYYTERGLRVRPQVQGTSLLARARARRQAGTDRRGRPLRPLAERTAKEHAATLRLVASRLVAIGELALSDVTSITTLIDADLLTVFLSDVEERIGLDSQYAESVVKQILSVGQRWVPDRGPEVYTDLCLLKSEVKRALQRGTMSDRDRARLAPFADPKVMARLVSLPIWLIEETECERQARGRVTPDMARRVETAIMCLIEQTIPVRRGTLVRTDLDRNIVWPVGAGDRALLHYGPEESRPASQFRLNWPPGRFAFCSSS